MTSRSPAPYRPAYTRYKPEVMAALMRIATALGTIRGARVLPAVADQLRASARVGTVHYSNLIEGNELPAIEAERATRGELESDTRAKVELINYVAALDLIDGRLADSSLELTPEFLLELHRATTHGLGRENDPYFRPEHEGEWRDGVAVVVDRLTQTIMHEGPPAAQVPGRIEAMLGWARSSMTSGDPPYVVAGVIHYALTDIHPFADGNGRVARLFQTAALMKAGMLPGRMFSFERYYAEDRAAYYDALRSVRARTLNMDTWLVYFLAGLAEEYERVAATVIDLGALVPGGRSPLRLTPAQQQGLTTLRLQGRREFTRLEYETAARLKRTAAHGDLADLVRHGVLLIRGSGPRTRYAFAGAVKTANERSAGRKTVWTDDVIERELRSFVGNRADWPIPAEFDSAGKRALYAAASRHGGIRRWRTALGR